MAVFQSRRFPSNAAGNTFAARYRRAMQKRPFLLFGLPFMTTMVAGSFFLTPATALRYERHDRRVQQLTREEELDLAMEKSKGKRRKVDMREEYYRLAAKDLDNWENRRVKRLPGEPDGKL